MPEKDCLLDEPKASSISNLAGASSLNILSCICFSKMRALTFAGQNPITLFLLDPVDSNKYSPSRELVIRAPLIQKHLHYSDEAERRRREAGVKQSMEIRLRSCGWVCMYICMYVWYLELSREPRYVAQQGRYQNVGLRNGHCLGTISSGCDF